MQYKVFANIDMDSVTSLQNSEFSTGKCYVMYCNENRNGTFISKESVEAALYSIKNIPIVGEYFVREDEENSDFGTHGGKIIVDSNGIKFEQTTHSFGVVPESANPRWEDVGGVEYLVVDVVLWSERFSELSTLIKDQERPQSMELSVYESHEEDNYEHLTKYEFSALCILGSDVEPCFEQSKIETYNLNSDEFSDMVKKYKKYCMQKGGEEKMKIAYSNAVKVVSDNIWEDVDNDVLFDLVSNSSNSENILKETYLVGSKYPHHEFVDERLVINKNGLIQAKKDFESDYQNGDVSEDDYTVGIEHLNRHYDKIGIELEEDMKEGYELTMRDKMQLFDNALPEDGMYYWIMDFDSNFVYINRWGDGVDDNIRASYTINEEENIATIDIEASENVYSKWLTKEEMDNINDERETLEASLAESVVTIAELKEYHNTNELDKKKDAIEAILSEFSESIGDTEEFIALEKTAIDIEIEDIKKECYAIEGMKSHTAKKPKAKDSEYSFVIDKDEDAPYGDAQKYLD